MMKAIVLVASLVLALPGLAQEPEEIVRDTTDRVIEMIDENHAHYEENPEALREDIREILVPTIDIVYSARLVLGRHGRGLEEDRIEEFADALAEQLLERYATALLEYDLRDRFEILPQRGENSERMTRVRTRIHLDSANRAPLDYVFRKNDGRWQVFDVIVEGISYVSTFRNQIGKEIQRDGFDQMLERLKTGEVELSVDE
ncbi:MAG: MlaC/ttg2D family ABC transporter substrate-binding protein [Wenzhouxiangella sp.]